MTTVPANFPLYATDTLVHANFPLASATDEQGTGTIVYTTYGPMEWVKAATDLAEGQVVYLTAASNVVTATLLSTAAPGSIGYLGVAVVHKAIASGTYGYVFIGPAPVDIQVLLATTISANTNLTTTGTAGTAGSGGTAIVGLVADASSGTGGLTLCRLVSEIAIGI